MTRRDLGAIAGISIAIFVIARMWTGLDTPDSSFYTSLALFGDQVTDRAPFDSYYWTRLGYIAPVMLLTTLTTPEVGYAIYRFILIAVIVASVYSLLKRLTPTSPNLTSTYLTRIYLTSAAATSTVILSYLGNPYLTGFILAASCAVIALVATNRTGLVVVAGVVVGWSAQVNPAGSLLVATLFIATAVFFHQQVRTYFLAAIAAGITFVFLIGVGTLIFPGLSWWDTFNATRDMNLSDFSSRSPVWLTDISLLVPLAVLILAITTWWFNRENNAHRFALVISSVSVSFLVMFSPLMGGIAMEAPMYQSMLWPPAMIASALIFSNFLNPRTQQWWLYALSLLVIMGAGLLQPTLTFAVGVVIAIGMILAALLASKRAAKQTATLGLVAVTIFMASAQLLQNSRTDLGLYFLSPYSWAFAPNPIAGKIGSAIAVQEWLLANTSNSDQILTWVDGSWIEGDRELYAVAAMQLWGENRLTLEPVVDDYARAVLEQADPSVIALYGRSQGAITTMWESIPGAGPLNCTDFTWSVASNTDFPTDSGLACLTRLHLP
jgi:hypothetical protein